MEARCPNCLEVFIPNKKDEKIISDASKKKQIFVMIECTNCFKDIPLNPCDLLSIANDKDNEKIIYCPVCKDGIVSHIKDDTEEFYGCGECGNIWKKIEDVK